jgi:hypothetical protein
MSACFICRRAAIPGLAFKSNAVCAVCAPNALGGEMMLSFSEAEEEAIAAGGETAGAFLDAIDKTDLAELTADEWAKFLGQFLKGYSAHMREGAAKHPPF